MSQLVKKIRTSAGDCQIDYNALANLPTISNPNLLINSDFRNPVNQRGQTIYYGQATRGYAVDRWCMGANDFERSVEVVGGGVLITNPNTQYVGTFQQVFEKALPQGDYTLSVKVASKTGTSTMSCSGSHNSTRKDLVVGINTLTLSSATINSFDIILNTNSSIKLEWAKLEVGTTATPFSPRPYAEEIAMCRRYFDIMGGTRVIGLEQDNVINTLAYAIPRNVLMARTPTITIKGTTTQNSTEGICIRDVMGNVIGGFTFTYSVRNWELLVTAKASSSVNKSCFETQLLINDAFKICLDAEIY